MRREDGDEAGAGRACWLVRRAGLALAVAVIRSKPPGRSSREHAEELASALRSADLGWRSRSRRLQQEVQRLQQEVLMARVTANMRSSREAAGPDVTVDDSSQDLFGPDSDTPELLLQDTQPPPPPPPPSGLHGGGGGGGGGAGGGGGGGAGGPAPPPGQLLQPLCALRRAAGPSGGPRSLWFCPDDGAGSLLVDSVCQLLDSVVAAFRDPPGPPGPPDQVLQVCRVAARAMDLLCSERLPSVEFRRRVEATLTELTDTLLHRQLTAAETLMQSLVTLGGSSLASSFLVRHVLARISAVADQLWLAFQGHEVSGLIQFPVDQYQNSFHLLRVVEELLRRSKVAYRPEGAEPADFLGHLEQRVFLLSDEFPLFSIYMWRIGSLLTCPDR